MANRGAHEDRNGEEEVAMLLAVSIVRRLVAFGPIQPSKRPGVENERKCRANWGVDNLQNQNALGKITRNVFTRFD